MKKNLFSFLCAATVFASCSSTDLPDAPGSNEPILATARALSLNADAQAGTRAAYTATDAQGMQALVLATQATGEYTTTYAKGSMTFDATDAGNTAVGYETTGFSGNSQLPADKSSLYLCALYPYDQAKWGSIGTTASYTFDGTQDVMAALQMEVAKMNGPSSDKADKAAFTFQHLLTKLDIKVKADASEAITAWGDVKKITVSKVKNVAAFPNTVAVTLASGTAATGTAAFSGAESSWKTYTAADAEFADQSQALTTTAALASTTMLAPFTATNSATDLVLAVVTKTASGTDYTSTVGVKIPTGDTQGNAYTVTLNFKANGILGTATVTGWTPKDAGEVAVE